MLESKQHKKSQSGAVFNAKKRSTMADVAVISLGDFERIKQTTKILSKADEQNLKVVHDIQVENQCAKGKSLKERMLELDKHQADKNLLSDLDKEKLEKNKILTQKVSITFLTT